MLLMKNSGSIIKKPPIILQKMIPFRSNFIFNNRHFTFSNKNKNKAQNFSFTFKQYSIKNNSDNIKNKNNKVYKHEKSSIANIITQETSLKHKFYLNPEYINPADCFILKKIFWYEEGKEHFKAFINSFLSEDEKVKTLSIISPVLEPFTLDGKKCSFDFSFKDDKNRFIVGLVQNHFQKDFYNKCLYFASRRLLYDLDFEINYEKINSVIFLAIVNFNIFTDTENHISILELMHQNDKKLLLNSNIKMIFIELPKFHLDSHDLMGFDWCRYLAYGDKFETNDIHIKYAQKIYKFYNKLK